MDLILSQSVDIWLDVHSPSMYVRYSLARLHHLLFMTISHVLALVVNMPIGLNMIPGRWGNVRLELLFRHNYHCIISIRPILKGQCLNPWRVAIVYSLEVQHLLFFLVVNRHCVI